MLFITSFAAVTSTVATMSNRTLHRKLKVTDFAVKSTLSISLTKEISMPRVMATVVIAMELRKRNERNEREQENKREGNGLKVFWNARISYVVR